MDQFRTIVRVIPSEPLINLNHKILALGSCFSDAIGSRLARSKISTIANPFGVIYNPISLFKAIWYIISNKTVAEHTFLQNQDIYLNYDFHSEFSALKKDALEEKINSTIGSLHPFLKDCRWIMITFGTAWVYERTDTGEIVANCHKMPAKLFNKTLLTQKKIIDRFQQFYNELKAFNPNINIILTVSPVRHIKDTLELNSVSKSVLRLTCHTLKETFADVTYFPSYEIMMDDLRDYRFYKSDMIHPTEQAEDYIWEQFIERYIDPSTKKFLTEWKSILAALQHKAFHPESAGHQIFLKQTLKRLEELKHIVNVDNEIEELKSKIQNLQSDQS